MLSVKDLTVSFPTDDGVVNAVRDISFDLAKREVLGIVGESGSGKSVSSLAMMGLLPGSARVTGSVKLARHGTARGEREGACAGSAARASR